MRLIPAAVAACALALGVLLGELTASPDTVPLGTDQQHTVTTPTPSPEVTEPGHNDNNGNG